MQGKERWKGIEMIIKMENEFKLTVVHFARSNPVQICACAWIYRWTKQLWKIRCHWAAGSPPFTPTPCQITAAAYDGQKHIFPHRE